MATSQLARVALNARVTSYAKGAGQSALERMTIANFLSPPVKVPGVKFEYWAYDDRAPYKIMKTARAIGGGANVLDTGGTVVTSVLDPNAIDAPIDQAELLTEPTLIMTLQERADEAAAAAALSYEYQVVSAALAAAGAGTDVNAAQPSTVDLKMILDQAILDVMLAAKSGSNQSVRILFGASAGLRFLNHQSIRGLFKGGRRDTATPPMGDVSDLLMNRPAVMQALTVVDSALEGLAASNGWLMDNAVLVFVANSAPTRRDPSFMKTFTLSDGVMKPGYYQSPDGRQEFAKLDWYTKPTVTNVTAVKRINLNAS